MKINSCLKKYTKETHRSETLKKTYENIKDIIYDIGITRIADITNLDRIGIPVYSCIRPEAKYGAISIYNGKGATKEAAKVSAIMEGIERYTAEQINYEDIILDKYTSLISKGKNALNPKNLILPNYIDSDSVIPWSNGYSIDFETLECSNILIPTNSIYHPFDTKYTKLFRTNTNGLASGNTIEEAIFHGLCELIERDAWSITEYSKDAGSVIENIYDEDINKLLLLFEKSGVNIILRNITKDINITTIAAISDDIETQDPTLLCLGMGTHTSPKIAILRALTEVAQSRATQIHGAREDTVISDFRKRMGYERTKKINSKWFENKHVCQYRNLIDQSTQDFKNEIKTVFFELKKRGLEQLLFYNLTDNTIKIPVVKVIVPGLECFSIDSERIGIRCKKRRLFI